MVANPYLAHVHLRKLQQTKIGIFPRLRRRPTCFSGTIANRLYFLILKVPIKFQITNQNFFWKRLVLYIFFFLKRKGNYCYFHYKGTNTFILLVQRE